MIKLKCIKTYAAHWGMIFQEGKEYTFEETEKEVTIKTDYENYYNQLQLVTGASYWIRRGYNDSNLHEVIPGYKSLRELGRLYTKRIKMPYLATEGDDGSLGHFYTLTTKEIMQRFNLDDKCLSKEGHIAFSTSEKSIDEFFDYSHIRRDNKLKNIGL